MGKAEQQKIVQDRLLYEAGMKSLGSKGIGLDEKVVMTVGFIDFLASVYATECGIVADKIMIDYKTFKVSYIKKRKIIESFKLTTKDLEDGNATLNRLLKEFKEKHK